MSAEKDKNTSILVAFPPGLIEGIEWYWHENKLMSRTEAIRQLIIKGLEAEKAQ